ncbi:odorant receptor 49b-like isoform X1 [Diabrotica virgifera virgifera]|uniref:Odorant receptor n=2 Tax=Diabrotica virgifera virgifera TaxID=50390 RepID=A0ABM5KLX6_DIAVI|nr:odorant receptor 49b-like isoform X1 [Diabrotica virgifera virgifera]XP_050511197.1 odorant receptor 49b-like isoform X1 [Diabrotica virgifera virgifera]
MAKIKNKFNYPSNLFETNEFIYKLAGVWIPDNSYSIFIRIIYFFYVTVFYGTGVYFLICEYMILNETVKNINTFVGHIGMLLTHTVGILKFYILVFGRKKIQNIMDMLKDDEYYYDAVDNFCPAQFLNNGKKLSTKLSVLLFMMYSFSGILSHTSSLMVINTEIKGDNFLETNKTCQDFMPFFFKIPFNTDEKWECELAFWFMDISFGIFAWLIACHDGLYVTLLIFLRCQLVILGQVFRSIRRRSLLALNLPKNFSVIYDRDHPEIEAEMYKQLTHYTAHLKVLLKARDKIEDMFSFVTLCQTLACLFIYSSALYNISMTPIGSTEFFVQLEYFICILLELSAICWFGNEITIASELIRLSLYESDWLSTSTRFKKSLILTMTRMQRPIYLTIGKFSRLTLATLVAVFRGSLSYFALFQSIQ